MVLKVEQLIQYYRKKCLFLYLIATAMNFHLRLIVNVFNPFTLNIKLCSNVNNCIFIHIGLSLYFSTVLYVWQSTV